jgi:hypothetical protein
MCQIVATITERGGDDVPPEVEEDDMSGHGCD